MPIKYIPNTNNLNVRTLTSQKQCQLALTFSLCILFQYNKIINFLKT